MGIRYNGKQGNLRIRDAAEAVHDPVFLKFNFSYMHKECFELTSQQSICLTQTLFGLSNRPWLQIMSERKSSGFETIPLSVFQKTNMAEPSTQFESNDRKLSNKRDVFRIKDTSTGRMIGRIYRNIFYVFYLDFDGKAYNHGS